MIIVDIELPDGRLNLAELILTSILCREDVKAEVTIITEMKGLKAKSMYSTMLRRNV